MLVNVEFLNANSKRSNLIFLYSRLRAYAASKGGYYIGMELTHNERYRGINELHDMGLVDKNSSKVLSHRKYCVRMGYRSLYARMNTKVVLASKESFRGFLIEIAEGYKLRQNYMLQGNLIKYKTDQPKVKYKSSWITGKGSNLLSVMKTNYCKSILGSTLKGRVFNSQITKLTGVSERTISRRRKFSTNTYTLTKVPLDSIKLRDTSKSYVCKLSKKRITIDQEVETKNKILFNKYHGYAMNKYNPFVVIRGKKLKRSDLRSEYVNYCHYMKDFNMVFPSFDIYLSELNTVGHIDLVSVRERLHAIYEDNRKFNRMMFDDILSMEDCVVKSRVTIKHYNLYKHPSFCPPRTKL